MSGPLVAVTLNLNEQQFVDSDPENPGPMDLLENFRCGLLLRLQEENPAEFRFRAELFEPGKLEALQEAGIGLLGVAVLGQRREGQVLEGHVLVAGHQDLEKLHYQVPDEKAPKMVLVWV